MYILQIFQLQKDFGSTVWFAWLLPPGSTVVGEHWIKMVTKFISTNMNGVCIDIPQLEDKLMNISIQNQPQVNVFSVF